MIVFLKKWRLTLCIVTLMMKTGILVAQTVPCNGPHDCEYYFIEDYRTDRDQPGDTPPVCLVKGGLIDLPTTAVFDQVPSWKVFNGAAIRIEMNRSPRNGDCAATPPVGYPRMFIYSEVNQFATAGTSQYNTPDNKCQVPVRISCLEPDLPQPDIFVPVDSYTLNPRADFPATSYRSLRSTAKGTGHPVLALRRAFFWENSEDLPCDGNNPSDCSDQGPYGDINISIVDPALVQAYLNDPTENTYRQLLSNDGLWRSRRFYSFDVPGPAYEAQSNEVPHDEWIDGPWGTVYSNLGIVDWDGLDRIYGQTLGLVISEADGCFLGFCNGEDFLGAALVDRDHEGLFPIIRVRMYGWLQVENVRTGVEPSVDFADVYVYPDWDGAYPVQLTQDNYCKPDGCAGCDPQHQSCPDFGLTCFDEKTVSARCDLDCGSPFQTCAKGCCTAQRAPMPEGSPYRPFHDLDTALENLPEGGVMGIFRDKYARQCAVGPPQPICPQNIVAECASHDGTPVTYEVTSSGNCRSEHPTISCNVPSGTSFHLGETTVTCTATDSDNNSSSCNFVVKVIDTLPPEITASVEPTLLWPPNHRLEDITSMIEVRDACDPTPSFRLVAISSNEADSGMGDGDRSDDIQDAEYDTADQAFRLRAERSGSGPGRTYSIRYKGLDHSGNAGEVLATVVVPHDQNFTSGK